MSRRRIIICVYFLCLTVNFLSAEMSFYPTAGDIPSFSISAITQDSSGSMWFGTRGSGVIKYNGSTYTLYTSDPFKKDVIPSNQVQCMMMDSGDILWIGTYKGLSRLDTRSGKFANYRVQNDVVCCILRDSRDRLWAGTLDGLCLLDEQTGLYRTFFLSEKQAKNPVRGLYEDSKGLIYACTYDGVFVYNERTDSFERPEFIASSNPLSRNTVYMIQEDADGYYWGASWGTGIVKTDASSKNFTVYQLPDNRIYCMDIRFSGNSVLAGTWGGGLYELFPETGRTESYTTSGIAPHSLPNNTVYSMFCDSLGLLWIGTHGGGIVTYDKNRSLLSAVKNEAETVRKMNTEPIMHVSQSSDGILWIAIRSGGLVRYVPETGAITEYTVQNGRLPNDMAYFCFETADGVLYAGTETGLAEYNCVKNKFEYASWYVPIAAEKPFSIVTTMMESTEGELWTGTYGGGLVVYEPVSGQVKYFLADQDDPYTISDALIYFIRSDSRGDIWLGTNNGLNKFDRKTQTFIRYFYDSGNTAGISGNQVMSFYENSSGDLLFGTNGAGLSVLDRQSNIFTTYTREQGLSSNTIVGILEVDMDMYWITTSSGLCLFDMRNKNIQVYRVSDGLQSDQFSTAPLETGDGSIWFGTSKGIVYLPSSNRIIARADAQPQPARSSRSMLTSVLVNGVPLETAQFMRGSPMLELNAVQRNIQITFSSLDYSPLARPSFTYQLKGFSDDWIPAIQLHSVQFTNLAPGSYVFTVKNTESLYSKPDSGTSFSFNIAVPLYKRWYFIMLYITAACFAVYGVVRVRDIMLLRRRVRILEDTKNLLQQSNRNLVQIANTDVLTGIHNRRGFALIADTLWSESAYHTRMVAFIMLDIDYFKAYNDAHGHPEGDKLLCGIAEVLTKELLPCNSEFCRYGGEEFLVMLPDLEPNTSMQIAERMRFAVENLHVAGAHPGHSLITISLGVYAGIVEPDSDWKQFVRFADAALYDAKNSGRNCVRMYTDGSCSQT